MTFGVVEKREGEGQTANFAPKKELAFSAIDDAVISAFAGRKSFALALGAIGLLLLLTALLGPGALSLLMGEHVVESPLTSLRHSFVDLHLWLGVACAGIFIATLLYCLQPLFKPLCFVAALRRLALLVAFAALCSVVFVLLQSMALPACYKLLGLLKEPFYFWGNFFSSMFWLPFGLILFLAFCVLVLSVNLIPDIALFRDRLDFPRNKVCCSLFSLGWCGYEEQWRHYSAVSYSLAAMFSLSLLMLPITFAGILIQSFLIRQSVGLLLADVFVTLFLAGFSIFTFVCLLIRHFLKLQTVITRKHLCALGSMLLLASLGFSVVGLIGYLRGGCVAGQGAGFSAEILDPQCAVFAAKWFSNGSMPYRFAAAGAALLPLLLLYKRLRGNPFVLAVLSVLLVISLWFERFYSLEALFVNGFEPSMHALANFSLLDVLASFSGLGCFLLLMALLIMAVPLVSLAEAKAALVQTVQSNVNPGCSLAANDTERSGGE